jgi:YegS/Rv2252/BmrU family lipid kinase
MPAGDRHLLLVNPSAGGGKAASLLPQVEAAMRERGLVHRTALTESVEHGRDEARAAAAAGEVTVVMSGDGLIGQVGGALADTDGLLGIVPGGRGNDLARVLGIPSEPAAAVEVLATGVPREIDVGEVNGERFLGAASCGFDSDANRIANETKLVKGTLVYAYAALRALIDWKPATFTLELDERTERITGYSVGAGNSKAYGGGMYAFPHAELDDGLLDVEASGNVGKLRFLRGVLQTFKGNHFETLQVRLWRVPEVRIEADRPFAVYADGDHLTDLPATVRILPRALQIVVPR